MKWYFKDVPYIDQWNGYDVFIQEQKFLPNVHITLNENNQYKFMYAGECLYWLYIDPDEDIVFITLGCLRSKIYANHYFYPFPYIDWKVMDTLNHKSKAEIEKYWMKFFMHSLTVSPVSFLSDGTWRFQYHKDFWILYSWEDSHIFDRPAYSMYGLFYLETPRKNVKIFSLKRTPDPDSISVKKWRKKIREGTLPPILMWYIPEMRSYFIMDGEDRLMASYIENQPPEVIIVYAIKELPSPPVLLDDIPETDLEWVRFLHTTHKQLTTTVKNKGLLDLYTQHKKYTPFVIDTVSLHTWTDEIIKTGKEQNLEDDFSDGTL